MFLLACYQYRAYYPILSQTNFQQNNFVISEWTVEHSQNFYLKFIELLLKPDFILMFFGREKESQKLLLAL